MRNNFRIKLSTARTAVFQVYGVGGGTNAAGSIQSTLHDQFLNLRLHRKR